MPSEQWTHPEPGDGPAAVAAQPSPEQVIAGLRATSEGGAELTQLLTPEGERVPSPQFDKYVDDIDDEALRGLYRDMVLVRRADREANAMQRQGQLGIWVPLLGQEAAQIGVGPRAEEERHGLPELPRARRRVRARGRHEGPARASSAAPTTAAGTTRATGFHPYTIVIGNQVLNAAGYAMGQKFEGKVGDDDGEATICYFGDGATSQGDVHEGFVWAAVYDAPLVFFCQNNQWAISEPTERQSRLPLYQRARGYGFPGIRVDGNDVLACLAVSRWALDECRHGNGPVLIEAFTYRMDAHTTTDDPSRYRLSDELEEWKLKDPIERVRAFLARNGGADHDVLRPGPGRRRRLRRRPARVHVQHAGAAAGADLQQRLRRGQPGARGAARRVPVLPRRLRSGG